MCDICSYFVRYVLIAIPDEPKLSDHSSSDGDDGSSDRDLLRGSLLRIQSYIDKMVVRKDVLVVLVGFKAMKTFRPPRNDDPDAITLIPVCEYSSTKPFPLPSHILFADETFLYAFAGTAKYLRAMVREVIDNSRSIL